MVMIQVLVICTEASVTNKNLYGKQAQLSILGMACHIGTQLFNPLPLLSLWIAFIFSLSVLHLKILLMCNLSSMKQFDASMAKSQYLHFTGIVGQG